MTNLANYIELTATSDYHVSGVVAAASSKLQVKIAEIRQRPVTWQSYHKSQMISDRDFKFITAFEAVKPENREEFLKQNASHTAETFLSLLSSLSKDQTTQYVLCLMNDIFLDAQENVNIFLDYCAEKRDSLWKHLFFLLLRDDPFIQHLVRIMFNCLAMFPKPKLARFSAMFLNIPTH